MWLVWYLLGVATPLGAIIGLMFFLKLMRDHW